MAGMFITNFLELINADRTIYKNIYVIMFLNMIGTIAIILFSVVLY